MTPFLEETLLLELAVVLVVRLLAHEGVGD